LVTSSWTNIFFSMVFVFCYDFKPFTGGYENSICSYNTKE